MKFSEGDLVNAVEELTMRRLRLWVRKGWIAPMVGRQGPRFDELDLARARLVCELKDELKLSEDAVDVVLSLMDQIYGLRAELRRVCRAVDEQPAEIKRRISRAIQDSGPPDAGYRR
ncbi:MAG: chaperone modulator CbpM [Alphaproteobacteria bacterium]|nr:chaperone modulator CbpM [Alphaproteobacteria bacterium]